MKTIKLASLLTTLTLMTAAASVASPFWEHPNTMVFLPEPTIPYSTNLNRDMMVKEFPQFSIHYAAGLVGYFGYFQHTGRMNPIWTTPNTNYIVDEFSEFFERPVERIDYPVFVPPVVIPSLPPNNNGKPPCWSNGRPREADCGGQTPPPPPDNADVPEPATFMTFLAGLVLVGLGSLKFRSQKQL